MNLSEFNLTHQSTIHTNKSKITYRNTFKTRMVAGELTKFRSSSLIVDCSNVSSRGLLEADVAIANAAAAVDVLLLNG